VTAAFEIFSSLSLTMLPTVTAVKSEVLAIAR
jgi:hypothetical protein